MLYVDFDVDERSFVSPQDGFDVLQTDNARLIEEVESIVRYVARNHAAKVFEPKVLEEFYRLNMLAEHEADRAQGAGGRGIGMRPLIDGLHERRRLRQIAGRAVPRHVSVILDGNRRYARAYGLPDPLDSLGARSCGSSRRSPRSQS